MPLEKLSWSCPTLGCHWRNSNFCSLHWNTTGRTVTAHTPVSKWTGLCIFSLYVEFTALQWMPVLLLAHVSTSTLLCACLWYEPHYRFFLYLGLQVKWNQFSSNNSHHTSCIHKGSHAGKWSLVSLRCWSYGSLLESTLWTTSFITGTYPADSARRLLCISPIYNYIIRRCQVLTAQWGIVPAQNRPAVVADVILLSCCQPVSWRMRHGRMISTLATAVRGEEFWDSCFATNIHLMALLAYNYCQCAKEVLVSSSYKMIYIYIYIILHPD